MKTRTSEVFENYIEISRKAGLISEAEGDKPASIYDSSEISDVEALYGVRPNGKDEKDIIDQAHPGFCVISPSYDRLNGLVETEKERHNVMVGICNKLPQAKFTKHRYAQKELFDELIRLGFQMDNKDQTDLSILADSCAEKLSDFQINKIAFPWIVAGVAAVLGVAAVVNNFGAKIDQGVVKNCDRAENLLTDLSQEKDHQNLSSLISSWIRYIDYVKTLGIKASTIAPVNVSVDNAHQLINDPKITEINKNLTEYAIACEELAKRIPSYISAIQQTPGTDNEADPDWWAAMKSVYHKFAPEKLEIVITALQTLRESLMKSRSAIEKRKSAAQEYVNDNQDDIMSIVQKRLMEEQGSPKLDSKPGPEQKLPQKSTTEKLPFPSLV